MLVELVFIVISVFVGFIIGSISAFKRGFSKGVLIVIETLEEADNEMFHELINKSERIKIKKNGSRGDF